MSGNLDLGSLVFVIEIVNLQISRVLEDIASLSFWFWGFLFFFGSIRFPAMPRSSRHKSSKHSSRDARDYSDPEKDSTLKEKKSRAESSATVSKESVSGEKRKLDHYDSLNGEYYEERTSSKRHREKIEDSGNDRWNGGDDERGEISNKSKASSERSRRREEVEGEETKKSSGRHRESSRRESKEFENRDKDSKYKQGKTDKLFDCQDYHGSMIALGKTGKVS